MEVLQHLIFKMFCFFNEANCHKEIRFKAVLKQTFIFKISEINI